MRLKAYLLVFLFWCAVSHQVHAVIYKDVGTGSDVSYLFLQFTGPSPEQILYTYHYDYSALTPLNGANLLLAVDAFDSLLQVSYSGSPSASFFMYELAYNGYSQPTYEETGNYSWTAFLSGGYQLRYDAFFQPVRDGEGNLVYDPVPSGTWSFANAGATDRLIAPGSWDAWVFGEYAGDWSSYLEPLPDVTPVPEPENLFLLGIAGFAGWLWKRKRLS